uniref:Uncharacterized protein n=1 Tax=Rhizophora mucronata TaxID=61149 RepID=A0A2P2NSX0_RHIMU
MYKNGCKNINCPYRKEVSKLLPPSHMWSLIILVPLPAILDSVFVHYFISPSVIKGWR